MSSKFEIRLAAAKFLISETNVLQENLHTADPQQGALDTDEDARAPKRMSTAKKI